MFNAITDISGISVGHYTDEHAATGCTVVLCEAGATAGVSARGGAPGTRETDLLRPGMLVQQVHAILLGGGSAFGLAAADGVMRYLEERGVGFVTHAARVPIVPAAILYDLGLGDASVRPGPDQGYAACRAASRGPVAEGSVGAGTGATVGKLRGQACATKGGVGTASTALPDGTIVAALAAVNALGEVVDPSDSSIVAGVRAAEGGFTPVMELLAQGAADAGRETAGNTTIAVVATNAQLTKEQANVLALMADDGLARAVRPSHSPHDGDVVFALATGAQPGESSLLVLGALAADVLSRAIVRAVQQAKGLHGIPGVQELSHG